MSEYVVASRAVMAAKVSAKGERKTPRKSNATKFVPKILRASNLLRVMASAGNRERGRRPEAASHPAKHGSTRAPASAT